MPGSHKLVLHPTQTRAAVTGSLGSNRCILRYALGENPSPGVFLFAVSFCCAKKAWTTTDQRLPTTDNLKNEPAQINLFLLRKKSLTKTASPMPGRSAQPRMTYDLTTYELQNEPAQINLFLLRKKSLHTDEVFSSGENSAAREYEVRPYDPRITKRACPDSNQCNLFFASQKKA